MQCGKRFARVTKPDIDRLVAAGVPDRALVDDTVDLDLLEQLGWTVLNQRLLPPPGVPPTAASATRRGLPFFGFRSVDSDNGFSCSREDRVVTIAGDFNATKVDDVGRCFDDTADSGDIRVDMSGVTFVESAALRVLVLADQGAGRRVVIVSPSEPVARLLAATGLRDRLAVEP